MQQQTINKKGKESPAYLDPQMVTKTQLSLNQADIVKYFVKAMRHYKDKDMLVVSFNTGNPIIFYEVRPSLVL
jgi:hypothetical protein